MGRRNYNYADSGNTILVERAGPHRTFLDVRCNLPDGLLVTTSPGGPLGYRTDAPCYRPIGKYERKQFDGPTWRNRRKADPDFNMGWHSVWNRLPSLKAGLPTQSDYDDLGLTEVELADLLCPYEVWEAMEDDDVYRKRMAWLTGRAYHLRYLEDSWRIALAKGKERKAKEPKAMEPFVNADIGERARGFMEAVEGQSIYAAKVERIWRNRKGIAPYAYRAYAAKESENGRSMGKIGSVNFAGHDRNETKRLAINHATDKARELGKIYGLGWRNLQGKLILNPKTFKQSVNEMLGMRLAT